MRPDGLGIYATFDLENDAVYLRMQCEVEDIAIHLYGTHERIYLEPTVLTPHWSLVPTEINGHFVGWKLTHREGEEA